VIDAKALCSIGYEKALLQDVIAALKAAGVATLIDVRDRPISRRLGFSKRQLAAAIEAAGMRYFIWPHSAPRPRDGLPAGVREWDRFWAIVDEKLGRPEAELDLQQAAEIAGTEPSCLLCYEADWRVCHRRRIAEILEARHGFAVRHLMVHAMANSLEPGK
jgi:uncharacterized protein (DUF488 family)